MLGLRVSAEMGEKTKRTLLEAGLLDKGHQISPDNGMLVFPLLREPDEFIVEKLNGEVIAFEAQKRNYTKERPFDRIKRELAHLPDNVLESIPMHWERYGHLLALHLSEELRPYFKEIATAYADVLGCHTVILDRGGIAGEYREPIAEVIYGTLTETTHIENGIRYTFDAARIMFSSGNVDERVRMGGLKCGGETVVDMFAGIGYFSLPLAKYTGAERVISIEKNPVAYRYLLKNMEQNRLNNITAYRMDNRDFKEEGIADRIIMGYIGTTHHFLDKALSILKERGVIHYHETCPEALLPERPIKRLKEAGKRNGRRTVKTSMRRIKSYAPGVYHVVVDAEFMPD